MVECLLARTAQLEREVVLCEELREELGPGLRTNAVPEQVLPLLRVFGGGEEGRVREAFLLEGGLEADGAKERVRLVRLLG